MILTLLSGFITGFVWLYGHPVAVIMMLGVIIFAYVLGKIQRSPKIDLIDLFIDTDGKASWTKITAIGAFLVGSWAAVYLAVAFGLGAVLFLCFYLIVYSGAPVAYRLAALYFGRGSDKNGENG